MNEIHSAYTKVTATLKEHYRRICVIHYVAVIGAEYLDAHSGMFPSEQPQAYAKIMQAHLWIFAYWSNRDVRT